MAIAEDVYERCRACTVNAATILENIVVGKPVQPSAVAARRTAADIAGDTTAALLRQAFITPIEREDLWRLRSLSERLWREAENTALFVSRQRKPLPIPCRQIFHAAAVACQSVGQAFEQFPRHHALACTLRPLRDAERLCHTVAHEYCDDVTTGHLCQAVLRLIAQAEMLSEALQYIQIKNA